MIYVDKVAGLASVEACEGVRFVAVEVEVRAIIIDGKDRRTQKDTKYKNESHVFILKYLV